MRPPTRARLRAPARFTRQVLAELGKVVTPSRGELLGSATGVLLFALGATGLILALDTVAGRLALAVFGGSW